MSAKPRAGIGIEFDTLGIRGVKANLPGGRDGKGATITLCEEVRGSYLSEQNLIAGLTTLGEKLGGPGPDQLDRDESLSKV